MSLRTDFKILLLVFKALYGVAPTYICDLMNLYNPKSQSLYLSGPYNQYSEWHPLSLDPWIELGKSGGKKMEETSGRATEEGSLSQDGQTCNRCCMYRKEQQNHSLQIALTDWDDWEGLGIAKWWLRHTTSSHRGDLEEGRPSPNPIPEEGGVIGKSPELSSS